MTRVRVARSESCLNYDDLPGKTYNGYPVLLTCPCSPYPWLIALTVITSFKQITWRADSCLLCFLEAAARCPKSSPAERTLFSRKQVTLRKRQRVSSRRLRAGAGSARSWLEAGITNHSSSPRRRSAFLKVRPAQRVPRGTPGARARRSNQRRSAKIAEETSSANAPCSMSAAPALVSPSVIMPCMAVVTARRASRSRLPRCPASQIGRSPKTIATHRDRTRPAAT